jgi:POT family proton-dependent oligopeptide transporter
MSEKRDLESDSPPTESIDSRDDELPAVRGRVPRKVWLVQGLYFLERAAYYGLSQLLRRGNSLFYYLRATSY